MESGSSSYLSVSATKSPNISSCLNCREEEEPGLFIFTGDRILPGRERGRRVCVGERERDWVRMREIERVGEKDCVCECVSLVQ